MTSVTIPNSVTSIGDRAFSGCSGLTSITCKAITPPTLGSDVFYDVNKSIPLYVPAESVEAYQTADQWKDFTNILPIGDTPEPCILASGTCGAEGDNLTWELSCDSVLTISGTGAMANYSNVPSVPWYSYNSSIASAIVENGVTSIGDGAFEGCSGLTSVTIPNSVTSIGYNAFYECTGLTSVTIPNSVTSIGYKAFSGCSGLTSPVYNAHVFAYMPTSYSGAYTIPDGIESIAGGAFAGCTGLTSVTIPNSVTSIGFMAFYYCSGLTSIEIPNSVTSIGNDAFAFCKGLTSVTIPNSVTSIGDDAFSGCKGLTSVTIPNSVTSIGGSAFWGCSGLTSVTIPNSVTSIGNSAFSGCTGLTSVTIPNSVTSIGNWAFEGCSGLTSVTIPNSVTSIGNNAFSNCKGLTSITCKAITPPTLGSDVFYTVDKSIPLYVPAGSVSAYQTADQWKDFTNIIGLDDGDEEESNIRYIDPSNNELGSETVSLHLPDVPEIEGFTFLKWQVVAGDLEEGIIIQAVYQADESASASSVYTNPANPAQKLIRNGNVYILSNEKTYSITGQEVIVP